jgi:hypothetical protein
MSEFDGDDECVDGASGFGVSASSEKPPHDGRSGLVAYRAPSRGRYRQFAGRFERLTKWSAVQLYSRALLAMQHFVGVAELADALA